MFHRIFSSLTSAGVGAALLFAASVSPVSADDTEIYQAEYNAATGSRPKVLIVFDDSGSMRGTIDSQRPPYDPNATYATSFTANRIYWSTNGSVPNPGNNNWFAEGQNRCSASFDSLDDEGRFTPERARRWVSSTIQQGQCTTACPAGGEGDVQGNELLTSQINRVLLEVVADEVTVIPQRLVERGKNDALLGQLRGQAGATDHLPVGENDLGGVRKVGQVGHPRGVLLGHNEVVEGQALEVGETPVLVGAGRHRQRGELVPGFLLGGDPPSRQVAALGEVGGESFGVEARKG